MIFLPHSLPFEQTSRAKQKDLNRATAASQFWLSGAVLGPSAKYPSMIRIGPLGNPAISRMQEIKKGETRGFPSPSHDEFGFFNF
jgi:hypothetical protein